MKKTIILSSCIALCIVLTACVGPGTGPYGTYTEADRYRDSVHTAAAVGATVVGVSILGGIFHHGGWHHGHRGYRGYRGRAYAPHRLVYRPHVYRPHVRSFLPSRPYIYR